jgi:hypothetical protein
MDDTPGATDNESVDWAKLLHIGAHAGAGEFRPGLDELGIDVVHRICNRAWVYSRADFEPSLSVALPTSQWRETCALAGSMAESLMLSAATYIECVWHNRLIAEDRQPMEMAIAQRYLADTAIDTIVSVGHRLINFVVRVARTAPDTRERLGQRFRYLGDTYVPFVTEDKEAWLSLNIKTINILKAALPELHHDSLAALDDLVRSLAWNSLFRIRAENFHRWRKEHEIVTGVDQHSGRATDLFDPTGRRHGRAVSARSRRHTASDGLTERTTQVAGDGLRAVCTTLDAVITDTLKILPTVAGGFTIEIDHDGRGHSISQPFPPRHW